MFTLKISPNTSKHKLFIEKVKFENKFIFDKIKN